jgi:hypothetical protein
MSEFIARRDDPSKPHLMPVLLSFVAGYLDSYTYLTRRRSLGVLSPPAPNLSPALWHCRQAHCHRRLPRRRGGDYGAHYYGT